MTGDSGLEKEYVDAVKGVLEYIQVHLDEEITPAHLARVACYSQHHFHRIFRAVVGESVMDHIRRLRLERAAYRLKADGGASVGMIALDAGYAAQEAFTRMFQAYFGMAPKAYQQTRVSYQLPASCGVHFGPKGFSPLKSLFDPILMDDTHLCPAHRDHSELFEERWEEMLSIVTGLASYVFSPKLKTQYLEHLMSTAMTDIDNEIQALEEEVEAAKLRLIEARRKRPREEVRDYVLKDSEGNDVKLSELFGDKEDLIVVHNMGTGCAYCTVWADGFTGLLPHLSDRASFVVCSPDKPEVQKRFAEKRHWNFKMVSPGEETFIEDLGFFNEKGYWPGASSFKRDADGKIYRVGKAIFGPNDDFCALWPFFDMLEGGLKGWEPKYSY